MSKRVFCIENENCFRSIGRLTDQSTYFSSLYPSEDYWQPIPELARQPDSTLTILFISSLHITHTKPSLDPVFHATQPRHVPGFQNTYYYNSDPRARLLACVDRTELCDPKGETCWSMTAPVPPNAKATSAYWLMKWSLENSNVYDAIKFRLGTALLAQQSISQSISEPLEPNQWQLEASHMFATTLARIQFDAWSIATGEDQGRPGYVEVTPDEAKGRLCNIVKIKTSDYTNINQAAFFGLIALALFIYIMNLDARILPKIDRPDGVMVIDLIARHVCDLVANIIVGLCHYGAHVFRKSMDCMEARTHQHHRRSPDTEQRPITTTLEEHG